MARGVPEQSEVEKTLNVTLPVRPSRMTQRRDIVDRAADRRGGGVRREPLSQVEACVTVVLSVCPPAVPSPQAWRALVLTVNVAVEKSVT